MHFDWVSFVFQLAAAGAVCAGFLRLFVESFIKERVKSAFDKTLEEHKATLDLLKQKALKDFGLFAEKKHDVNTAVYSSLRNSYQTISSAYMAWRSPVRAELFTLADLEEFLVSAGAPLDERRDLGLLLQISPQIAGIELNRRLPAYTIDKAEQSLQAAMELAYTSELFLSIEVIRACDVVIKLLSDTISRPLGDPAVAATLDGVPKALWKVKSSMRSDLLGPGDATDDPLVDHEEDFRGLRFKQLPTTIDISGSGDFEDRLARLVERKLRMERKVAPATGPLVDKEQALNDANAKVTVAPEDPEALLNRARLLLRAKRFREAEADAKAVLAKDTGNVDATLIATECYLSRLPGTISATDYFDLGRIVIGPLTDYLSKHPEDTSALHMRAYALMKTGEYEAAKTDLLNILDKEPLRYPSRALLADVYRKMDRVSEAIDEADRVLADSPGNLLAQLTRLELLAKLNRWRDVAIVCPQALEVGPSNSRIIWLYGKALNMEGRSNEVLKFDGRYKDVGPARTAALPALAQANLNLRNFEVALKYAEEALAKVPRDPEANLIKTQCLLAMGRWKDAINCSVMSYGLATPRSTESDQLLRIMRSAYKQQQDSSSASASKDGRPAENQQLG